MGILTDLIRTEADRKAKKAQALGTLLSVGMSLPKESQNRDVLNDLADQIGDLYGGGVGGKKPSKGGGVKGKVEGAITGFGDVIKAMVGLDGGPKPEQQAQQGQAQQGQSQQQQPQGRPTPSQLVSGRPAGQSKPGLFASPEQEQATLKQQEDQQLAYMQKLDAEKRKAALQTEVDKRELLFDEGRKAGMTGKDLLNYVNNKTITEKPLTANEIFRQDAFSAFEEKYGHKPAPGEETMKALREAKEKEAASKPLTGALGQIKQARDILDDPKSSASDKAAAKEFLDAQKAKESSVTIRNIIQGENARDKQTAKTDAESVGDAIVSGRDTPDMAGLGRSGMAGKVRAYIDKNYPDFSIKQANEDWQSTKRWISTQNGATQTRLRQATEFGMESMDLVDSLSEDLSKHIDRSKFPIFNKAALEAAKQGLMGQEAQIAANNLDQEIQDIQAEIATVYKGGNSPTDIGMKQASTMFKSEWNEKTLKAATNLARKNLRIRLNSIRNVGPISGGVETQGVRDKGEPEAAVNLPKPSKPGASLTADQTIKFLDAAGGDKEKARKMAKDAGFNIPK